MASAFVATAGCAPPAGPPLPTTTSAWDPDLGVAFELPPHWEAAQVGGATIWSGAKDTDAHYTTITVQAAPGGSAPARLPLDDALEAAYASVADAPGFGWDWLEPTSISGVPALRYAVRFELHEALRRKAGVLLATAVGPVDVAYGASASLFDAGLPIFEGVLATLWVDPQHRADRVSPPPPMVTSAP